MEMWVVGSFGIKNTDVNGVNRDAERFTDNMLTLYVTSKF